MATLSETLATSKTRNPYATAGYPNVYRTTTSQAPSYGARLNYGSGTQGADPSLYTAMLARTQAETARPIPSANYQANYNFDPILARLEAMRDMTVPNARAEAANMRKRAVIESGDEGLARELAADDPNTIEAAAKNEFGTRQLLNRDFADRGRQLAEAMNNANLYYSGSYVDELARQDFGRRQAENEWMSRFRELYQGIGERLLAQEQQALLDQAAQGAAGGGVGLGGFPGVSGGGSDVPPAPMGPQSPTPEQYATAFPTGVISSGPSMISGPATVAPPAALPLVQPFLTKSGPTPVVSGSYQGMPSIAQALVNPDDLRRIRAL